MLQKIRAWWMTGKKLEDKVEEERAKERGQAVEAQGTTEDPFAIREDELGLGMRPLVGDD
jgi:hypothetical protein